MTLASEPFRLALGADAVEVIGTTHEVLRAELERWEALGVRNGVGDGPGS
jgi:hypothetical protein